MSQISKCPRVTVILSYREALGEVSKLKYKSLLYCGSIGSYCNSLHSIPWDQLLPPMKCATKGKAKSRNSTLLVNYVYFLELSNSLTIKSNFQLLCYSINNIFGPPQRSRFATGGGQLIRSYDSHLQV